MSAEWQVMQAGRAGEVGRGEAGLAGRKRESGRGRQAGCIVFKGWGGMDE